MTSYLPSKFHTLWYRFRDHLICATPIQRAILTIYLNTPFILLFAGQQSVGLFVPEWRLLMNPEHIIAVNFLQLFSVVTQWVIAWKLWPHRFSARPVPHIYRVIASFVCVSYAAEAFLGGNLTYPTSLVIICIIPIGLMLLDMASVMFAFVVGVTLVILNDIMIFNGYIDYAPGYSPNAFIDGKHHVMAEVMRTLCLYLHFIFYAVIFWGLFAQHEYHRQLLQEAAQKDPLTGLANRRYFMSRLQSECDQQSDSGLCLVLVDADHFKRINDTYGHPVGDQVLKAIAGILLENMRSPSDIIGRIGGEEFALLLPQTDKAGALTICERIQATLAVRTFGGQETPFKVSLSMGLVESHGDDVEKLLHLADDLLYLAKAEGRNCIRSAETQADQAMVGMSQARQGAINRSAPPLTEI